MIANKIKTQHKDKNINDKRMHLRWCICRHREEEITTRCHVSSVKSVLTGVALHCCVQLRCGVTTSWCGVACCLMLWCIVVCGVVFCRLCGVSCCALKWYAALRIVMCCIVCRVVKRCVLLRCGVLCFGVECCAAIWCHLVCCAVVV